MDILDLGKIIKERLGNKKNYPDSYTVKLVESGINRVAQKVGEEAIETVIEAVKGDKQKLTGEVSDLIYHLSVLLVVSGLGWQDILKELDKRHSS